MLAMSSSMMINFSLIIGFLSMNGLSASQVTIICCNIQHLSGQHSNCQTLDSLDSELLPNNSVLELTNGSCNLTHSLSFTRVSNITIRGQGSQYTHISCHHMNAGLVFNQSSNIELRDFTIDSCGVQIEELIKITGNASKSIVFMNTTNVVLQGLVVTNSNGYGLVIQNCFENLSLSDVTFRNNKLTGPETDHTHGGGGLVIIFKPVLHQKDRNKTHYDIRNCRFENNSNNIKLQEKERFKPRLTEKGGGMRMIFFRNSFNIQVVISSCHFENNTSTYGGGLFVQVSDNSSECKVIVNNSIFIANHGEVFGGGGADVGFTIFDRLPDFPRNCSVLFESVQFRGNVGYIGGGVSIFTSTNNKVKPNMRNNITFTNCSFVSNSATGGAAVDIRPDLSIQHGSIYIIKVSFKDTQFIGNVPTHIHSDEQSKKTVFQTSEITVRFLGSTLFADNKATALYSASSLLIFSHNSSVKFIRNTGEQGGAVTLTGNSRMQLKNNTYLEFVNNSASYGGAICAMPALAHYTDVCFLYPNKLLLDNYDDNITLVFTGNKAFTGIGNDIYAISLAPCLGLCQFRIKKKLTTAEIFKGKCIGNFSFSDGIYNGSISTIPQKIDSLNSTYGPIPGFPLHLNISQIDEMGNDVGKMFILKASLQNTTTKMSLNHATITHNSVIIYGNPGKSGALSVENVAPVIRRATIEFKLVNCPPGFTVQKGNACQCSAFITSDKYSGISNCENNAALITLGYWAGYIGNESEDTLYTGICDSSFCNYGDGVPIRGQHILPNTTTSREELEKIVCGESRRGILCGKCADGYIMLYHSRGFLCYRKELVTCWYGPLLYIVSELLPVTAVFLVILIFNISLTSGALYSFVFYAQVLDSQFVDAFGSSKVNDTVTTNIFTALRIFYGSFNLNMFNVEDLSFCLISGANVMDLLLLRYATILYAVMLVIATVLVLQFNSCYCCVKLGNRCGRRNIRGSIVDGLSAFLVLCYFLCSRTTFQILIPITLRRIGKEREQTVPLFNGDVMFLGTDHLPYAVPAIICLLFMIIPLPCVLVFEPVVTKIFNLQICNAKVTNIYTKVRMSCEPFLDSFQSTFKDKYRFVAGLYFAYRAAATATYFSPSVFSCYVSLEVILFLIVFIHVILRPHKESWHNIIEFVILINLLFVNTATLLNYSVLVWGSVEPSRAVIVLAWLQILAMLLPIIYLAVYTVITIHRRLKNFYSKTSTENTHATLSDDSLDSMGFPARMLQSNDTDDYKTF